MAQKINESEVSRWPTSAQSLFSDVPAADFKQLNSSALITDGIGRYP